MREILVNWTLVQGRQATSVLYFDDETNIAVERQAIHTWLMACRPSLSSGTRWTVATEGREMSPATGTLTGAWNETTEYTNIGTGGANVAADATQILVRWNTGIVVGGRFLTGRTFLPGVAQQALANGNLAIARRTEITDASTGFAESSSGFGIWHRPKGGSGGLFAPAVTGTAWQELAVQRRRRA